MGAFSANISAWVAETKIKPTTVLRKVVLDMYLGILLRSIVDKGRFRASHRIGINAEDSSVASPYTGDEPSLRDTVQFQSASAEELGLALSAVSRLRFGDTAYLTNSLPYAAKLESVGSAQNNFSVDGIYKATFTEVTVNFSRLLRSI